MQLANHFVAIRDVHVTTVAISYTLFFVRGLWMIRESPRLRARWVRIVPHVNDTVLLASAVTLTFIIHQYPGTSAWLTAKVAGLLLYIALGTVALGRRGGGRGRRIAAWLLAQGVFLYIVAVAVTRDPLPFAALGI